MSLGEKAAMIAQIVAIPIGVFTVLQINSCFTLIPSLAVVIFAFATGDDKLLGQSDLAALAISIGFLVGYLLLCIYFHAWHRLESNFDSWPWNSETTASTSGLPLCPFSGKEVEMKCPVCNTLIHSSAFYEESEVLMNFVVGEGPCLWKQSTEALQRSDAPAIGRIQLDEALQLRGNYILGGVGNACIGCVIWQKCFYVLQKFASTLACLGFISASAPWGLHSLIKSLQLEPIHYATAGCSTFFSTAAFLVQVHAVSLCMRFMKFFSKSVSFPFAFNPEESILTKVVERFSSPGSDNFLRETALMQTGPTQ